MEAIACVLPVDNIRNGLTRGRDAALGEQIGALVGTQHEFAAGCITFAEDDMADDAEPCGSPRSRKLVNMIPAIEADAIRLRLKNAIDLRERGTEPGGVVVVVD